MSGTLTPRTPWAWRETTPETRASLEALLPDGSELWVAGVGRRWILSLFADGVETRRVKVSRNLPMAEACAWFLGERVAA